MEGLRFGEHSRPGESRVWRSFAEQGFPARRPGRRRTRTPALLGMLQPRQSRKFKESRPVMAEISY